MCIWSWTDGIYDKFVHLKDSDVSDCKYFMKLSPAAALLSLG